MEAEPGIITRIFYINALRVLLQIKNAIIFASL